jgi:hypothetical protein
LFCPFFHLTYDAKHKKRKKIIQIICCVNNLFVSPLQGWEREWFFCVWVHGLFEGLWRQAPEFPKSWVHILLALNLWADQGVMESYVTDTLLCSTQHREKLITCELSVKWVKQFLNWFSKSSLSCNTILQ